MPKGAGRNMVLRIAGTAVAGVRVTTLKFDAAPIDVTDQDSDGIVTYLAGEAATKQLTITVSGLLDSSDPRSFILTTGQDMLIPVMTLTDPSRLVSSDVLTGAFFMTSFEQTGAHDAAIEFTASFASSGNWAFS